MITLATLPEATAQEVFDQVAYHLLRHKKKSMTAGGFCAYLNDDGLQCVTGCLINEDEYLRSMEGNNRHGVVMLGLAPSKHEKLIGALQDIHDNFTYSCWKKMLWDLALVKGLSTVALENDQQEDE
jgi:hypothetical protein